MKIAAIQLNPIVGDVKGNTQKIIHALENAKGAGIELAIFPECAISGYPVDDILLHEGFAQKCEAALEEIIRHTDNIYLVIGLPRRYMGGENGKHFVNSAAVVFDKCLLGYQDKILLPTYDVFDEKRYFRSGTTQTVWHMKGKRVGIAICEDIWTQVLEDETYQEEPLAYFEDKIDLFISISASIYSRSKIARRKELGGAVAKRLGVPSIIVNQVGGNDGILFDGTSAVYMADGRLAMQAMSFAEDTIIFSDDALEPVTTISEGTESELFFALVMGVRDYFSKQGFEKALLGMSGGVDSSLVACIATIALGKKNVLGVLLPSQFTSTESSEDALIVADNLGLDTVEVPIESILESYGESLAPLFHGKSVDSTEENIQSRVRATVLMAIANKEGYLLLNTGNKSEAAVGYTTLYGDSAGALSVIGDLLKREVYELSKWISKTFGWIPPRVLEKAPTAELRHNQKDSDTIPEYSVLDPIVEEYIVHKSSKKTIAAKTKLPFDVIERVVDLIHRNEFKRRQMPMALRISEKCFSVGRRVPVVMKME